MNITKIKSTGIKRQNIDIEPRRVNLILGKNGAGKSAIKDTLELALLGYSPGIGKRPGDIFKLSKRDPIVVDVATDGGAIHREWKRNGKGVKSTSDCDIEIPAVMLDLSSVTSLTKAERQKYFLSLVDVQAITWESVTAAIKNVEVTESTEQTELAIASVVARANSAKGDSVQDRLSGALDIISEQTKKVNAEIKDHEGTARTFSRQEELAFDVPVTNAKKAMQAARAEVEAAAANVQTWQKTLDEYEAKSAKLKALQSEPGADVSELDKSLLELVGKISDAEVNLETLTDKLAAMEPEAANKTFNELSTKVATLTAEYSAIKQRGKDLESQREASWASAKNAAAQRQVTFAKEETRVNREIAIIEKKSDEFSHYTECPTCHNAGESWKDDLLALYQNNIQELRDNLQTERDLFDETTMKNHEEADKVLADFNSKITDCATELEAKKAEGIKARKLKDTAELDVKACEVRRQEATDAQGTLNKLNYEQKTVADQRQAIIDASAGRSAAIANLEAELQLECYADAPDSLKAAQEVLDTGREALVLADKDLQTQSAELGNKLTLLKSMKRRDEVTAELIILKGATKVLLEMQQTAINGAFEPLVAAIRKFTDDVLDTPPIDFFDGEFGYWLDDVFVEIDTFSGSQRRLALLGQMIAFASASNAPLKVAIIDELGDFEPTVTRPALIERLIDLATDGTIDHAFLMANDLAYYDIYKNGCIDVLVHEVTG